MCNQLNNHFALFQATFSKTPAWITTAVTKDKWPCTVPPDHCAPARQIVPRPVVTIMAYQLVAQPVVWAAAAESMATLALRLRCWWCRSRSMHPKWAVVVVA